MTSFAFSEKMCHNTQDDYEYCASVDWKRSVSHQLEKAEAPPAVIVSFTAGLSVSAKTDATFDKINVAKSSYDHITRVGADDSGPVGFVRKHKNNVLTENTNP